MTIWNFGFVSQGTEDIVAGYGASLFQIEGAGFSGPVRTNAKDQLTFDLQFTIAGDTVSGSLRPEGGDSGVVELSGSRTLHTVPGDFPCTETVRMTGGNTYLLLERSHKECPP
jgi:hypothetical protein